MKLPTKRTSQTGESTTNSHLNQYNRLLRLVFPGWLALFVLLIAASLFPIKFASLRLFAVCAYPVLWLLALFLLRKRATARNTLLAAGALCATFLALPGRDYSRQQLRQNYVNGLQAYEGTKYIWGGENRLGIDCSGLVRRGYINANLKTGLATLNPALVRASLDMWWNDCSAKAMMEEYRGKTHVLMAAKSLNELDYNQLLPGDFAVTKSGVHTLAYLGGKTWIEADPNDMRVIRIQVPTKNAWFNMPMKIVRWRQFEPG